MENTLGARSTQLILEVGLCEYGMIFAFETSQRKVRVLEEYHTGAKGYKDREGEIRLMVVPRTDDQATATSCAAMRAEENQNTVPNLRAEIYTSRCGTSLIVLGFVHSFGSLRSAQSSRGAAQHS